MKDKSSVGTDVKTSAPYFSKNALRSVIKFFDSEVFKGRRGKSWSWLSAACAFLNRKSVQQAKNRESEYQNDTAITS